MTSIIGVVIFLLLFFFVVLRAVMKALKERVTTGLQGIVGETGVVLRDINKTGKVLVHGEIWNARSEEDIKQDEKIVVMEIRGLELLVKKA